VAHLQGFGSICRDFGLFAEVWRAVRGAMGDPPLRKADQPAANLERTEPGLSRAPLSAGSPPPWRGPPCPDGGGIPCWEAAASKLPQTAGSRFCKVTPSLLACNRRCVPLAVGTHRSRAGASMSPPGPRPLIAGRRAPPPRSPPGARRSRAAHRESRLSTMTAGPRRR
jgi:hypothetical protein